jgi:hypothetical protein
MNINMKTSYLWLRRLSVAAASALFTLALVATSRSSAEESGRFVVVPVDNPRYCGNEMFRAINLFGVAGPEHHVEIAYHPHSGLSSGG